MRPASLLFKSLQPRPKPPIPVYRNPSRNCAVASSPTISFCPRHCRDLLHSCNTQKNASLGRQVHAAILTSGLRNDSFLSTQLVNLYSQCGDLPAAESVFQQQCRDCSVHLLNAMIRGYVSHGSFRQAVGVFCRRAGGARADSYTFSSVLKACGSMGDVRKGREVHGLAVLCGFDSDLFVANSLICMYGRCGGLEDGVRVFDRMPHRDLVSWNSVLSACANNGFGADAMVKVQDIVRSGMRLDEVTVVGILSMCCCLGTARELHCFAMRNGLDLYSVTICNALLSAYGKYGRMTEARRLFDNSVVVDKVSWNALISCYAQHGLLQESLQLLREMKESDFDANVITYSGIISSLVQNNQPEEALTVFRELLTTGLELDAVAVASVFTAVSYLRYLRGCKELHAYSCRRWLESDRRVRNALVSSYSKCGSVQDSVHVFEKMKDRDVISWGSMLAGYSQNGCYNEAINTFRQMVRAEVELNPITITCALSTFAGISGLKQGKEVHLWAIKNALDGQTFVGSALVDMYAKCGELKTSRLVFDIIEEKNLVTWNSMICGYAIHGRARDAIELFQNVEEPDEVSFISALSACSHGGLVKEGIEIFNSMRDFQMSAREDHYSCVIDMLGRSGRLDQALELVRSMPMEVSMETWGALLGACKLHSNLEVGIYSGAQMIETGTNDPGYYVLLSNILANFGRWDDVEVLRKLMREKGVKKIVGCSWIELDEGVHSFTAREHRVKCPEWNSMLRVLKLLDKQMKTISY